MSGKKVLITGTAGFIGFHLARTLLEKGIGVAGLDNLNDYYDVNLKNARLGVLKEFPGFSFLQASLEDREQLGDFFLRHSPETVVNLAAQAGVRYSLENPAIYIQSNIVGFATVLELCRQSGVKHLVYASSSSVYGANRTLPFSEADSTNHPISLYGATKKANELLAHAYATQFNMAATGLRFFTAYGPWGRPDMAYFKFTKAILEGNPIEVYNNGNMKRDFTHISDIVDGILTVMAHPAMPDNDWNGKIPRPDSSYAPYRLFNIGCSKPIDLMRVINILEENIGKRAIINFLPLPPGDIESTYADVNKIDTYIGFRPKVSIEQGLPEFVKWYRGYYRV